MRRFILPMLILALLTGLILAPDSDAKHCCTEIPPIAMACFVDTPGFDSYTTNYCGAIGYTTTSASFTIQGLGDPTGYSISWSEPGCSGLTCTTTVSPFQPKTVSATVSDFHGASETVSATAYLIF